MSAAYAFSPPERPCFPPYLQWHGEQPFLSGPECRELIEIGNGVSLGFGTIGNGDNYGFKLDKGYRCVRTRALYPTADRVEWLYQRIQRLITAANHEHYRFDLTGIEQGVQFLRYDAPADGSPAGHYKWHQDFGGGASSLRKLSLVVQLSAPEEYEGCELRLFTDCDYAPRAPDGAPVKGQGDAVLFPAWTPHMVTPITRGTRYALAAWVCGPQLR
jgi:PKHD-type hydroxylase